MDDEIKVNYPEKIWMKMVEKFEERGKSISNSDKDFYTALLNPGITVKAEIPALNKFIDSIKNDALKNEFTRLIENFEDYELYKRFLASILIYNRIDNLADGIDKFLYICIAVEAAMHFKSNPIKEKGKRFKLFFKENLSTESKLEMISSFKNKKFKNVIEGSNLANHKYFGVKLKKIKRNVLLPSCYRQKECFFAAGECYPDRYCYLKDNDETKVNEQLDFILTYLYAKRSEFVHEGIGFSLESKEDRWHGLRDLFYDPIQGKNVEVHFKLYLEDLFNFYEEALLNQFNRI